MGRTAKPFNDAFRGLKTLVKSDEISPAAQAKAQRPALDLSEKTEGEESDDELFAREMARVKRFEAADKVASSRPALQLRPPRDEDAEVIAELDALVDGRAEFDLRCSDEHVEGIAQGIDRRVLRNLRRGDFSWRRHLDLHGLTRKQARPVVERFLQDCRRDDERCVLVVHGRGINSKDQIPVLKEALTAWLVRGRIGRSVLAFCSARPSDGGLGAVYVLLRRR